jgi:hypothetical protein
VVSEALVCDQPINAGEILAILNPYLAGSRPHKC